MNLEELIKSVTGNWNYPTKIWFGPGRIQDLPQACQLLGMSAPLIVTDKGLAGLPFVAGAGTALKQAGLSVAVFSEVRPNPTEANISDGVVAYHRGKHDGVIALGGGSSLDAGKAIALMVGQTDSIWAYEDVGDNWSRVNVAAMAPVVAIPTTAGTGSEVGRASVINDVNTQLKKIIFHPHMMPGIVIADPELTLGLSPEVTAATGMDALSHNLEALCAPGYHPLADGIALEAIRLIDLNLVRVVSHPDHLQARSHMLCASLMGATAFQKGLGGMHALAHPLGAMYDAHHGLLNAILMPYVLAHNRDYISGAMVRMAHVLGLQNQSVEGVIDWVLALRQEIGIPHTLTGIGVESGEITKIAAKAVADPSSAGNPKPMDAEQYGQILEHALGGSLS
ncbi:MAG: iron-containing alcohol dehydrogenase [Gammaproteobacteria bacterium]|nr:iron-containing alcohol dehydrogenase [Gammaproteobacteria bacterium]MDH5803197.1 iron-containing alcohol dehydrogenase [Gammaproteobacteria bacterium]